MYALRAGDSDETPAIGSPPGCLSALDPYPDLVCESHRTLSNRSSMGISSACTCSYEGVSHYDVSLFA